MSRRRIGQEKFGFAVDRGQHSSLDALAKVIDWVPIDQALGVISCSAKGECAAAIKVRFVLPHPRVFPKNNAVASLRCSRLPHWLFPRFSLCRFWHYSIMISLHDLHNFRLPRGIGEWPEHQRIGLRTAPDLHSTLHGPNEAIGIDAGVFDLQTIKELS